VCAATEWLSKLVGGRWKREQYRRPEYGAVIRRSGFPGFVGQAFSFDGSTAYLQASTLGMPTGNADRTLEMWVKLDSIVPSDNPTTAYFESFLAGYGNFGMFAQTFHLIGEYQPPYGNALAWSP
jgi:hypothetical protein